MKAAQMAALLLPKAPSQPRSWDDANGLEESPPNKLPLLLAPRIVPTIRPPVAKLRHPHLGEGILPLGNDGKGA